MEASSLATNNWTKLKEDIRFADMLMHQSANYVISLTGSCMDFEQKLAEVVNYSFTSFVVVSVRAGR
jgi:hypothetical protein